jgi:serine/threonine protein kinase
MHFQDPFRITEAKTMLGLLFLRKYRTVRQLDEGGMCKIFLARPVGRPEEVVVKVLREDVLGHVKAREHFRREIFIMSRFQHPHAVAYIDAGPNEKPSPVLVMEYVRGTDLATVLARATYFSAERAGRILAQLCEVLGAAHAQGIVHRDLKPGNVMLLQPGTQQEGVKLMDFGLAKMDSMLYLDAEAMFDWSVPAASGTPEYIAPEQVRSSDVDSRADIYSLGVLLFEMLTGYRPFDSPDLNALLRAHMAQPPPTFRSLGVRDAKTLAAELVVRRCLGKSPEGRFQNTTALIEAYERALGKALRPPEQRRGGRLTSGGRATGPPHLASSSAAERPC